MPASFHANGKLLLSGEYFVLDGAKAIGLPCKLGQSLNVTSQSQQGFIHWNSKTPDGDSWYEGTFQKADLSIIKSSNPEISKVLQNILIQAQRLNPDFLNSNTTLSVETILDFPRLWGLGTSSTLIYNIANWSQTNAFQLSALTLGGSGYDIACAGMNQAILYQIKEGKPLFEKTTFHPDFKQQLFFVYLSKKQNSREGIKRYREKVKDKSRQIQEISDLSIALLSAKNLLDFQKIIIEHEQIISHAIEMPKIKDLYFSDFNGVIKSLGAWGGDFVLAATQMDRSTTQEYFNKKGFEVFFEYEEMVF